MVDLHTVLQSINHYLSTWTHDLGISILSETCYKTLVLDVDLTSNKCIKLAISKVLGISIIAISSIVKVPQILKIISAGSASGISILSYLLETFAYLISLAYNVRQGFPFSTYGETGLIMAQNIVIIVLVLNYSGTAGIGLFFIACLAMSAVILFSRDILHIKALSYLQASAGVIGIASKLPQILTVWQEGGTGQLSAFVVLNYLAGSLSRIFTTLQEVDDKLTLYRFIAGFALNGILALQTVMYWNTPDKMVVKYKENGRGRETIAIGKTKDQ